MTHQKPPSILFLGSGHPLAGSLEPWVRTHFAEPLEVGTAHSLAEGMAYLRAHQVDLVLVDEAAARAELRTLHTASPATAIIALTIRTDPSTALHMLRAGAHEVLCLLPSADTDHVRTLERALARVKGRTGILKDTTPRSTPTAATPRLIHDLNNLLTSINGFADLLLNQLAPEHPARMGAEQIRLAGKRAATLLKAQPPASEPSMTPTAQPITVRAA